MTRMSRLGSLLFASLQVQGFSVLRPRNIHQTMSTRSSGIMSATTASRKLSPKAGSTLDPCVILMKQLMEEYQDRWKDNGGIYSLAQGVVYWEPPDTVLPAVLDATSTLHQYGPDEGLPQLRDALETKLRDENGLTNHVVMVTAGANQAYMNSILTLLGDDDQSVYFRPFYFNHVMSTQLAIGNQGVLLGTCDSQGIPDIDWLESQLSKPNCKIKVVTITNPCNPTGVLLERSIVQRIVDLCGQYKVWLILDCTYEHFQHSVTNQQEDAMSFQGFPEDHVLHIFSFSKGYAMAGYRCGYIVVSKTQTEFYNNMRKVQDTIPICVARFAQHAALGALQAGRSWVLQKVTTLEPGRKAILDALQSVLPQVMGGSGAMYCMGKLPLEQSDDVELARALVKDHGVAVIPGTYCGFPGWIRVCYSNLAPDECLKAAKRLKGGLEALCNTEKE